MASWTEIERLRKQPEKFCAIARGLLVANVEGDLSEWEVGFLESIVSKHESEGFSLRQSEKLLEIRDGATAVTSYRVFSLAALASKCFEARLDLPFEDEQWLAALQDRQSTTYKLSQARRLMRCARQLGIVEEEIA